MNDPYAAIRRHLKTLKLKEMDKWLDDLLTKAVSEKIPASKVLEQLLECEATAFLPTAKLYIPDAVLLRPPLIVA